MTVSWLYSKFQHTFLFNYKKRSFSPRLISIDTVVISFMWRFLKVNLLWAWQRTLTPNPSWTSGVVATLWHRWGWHCHNLVARSKIRVVATQLSKIFTTSVFHVFRTLLQRLCTIATTLTIGFLSHFTTDYSDSFPTIISSNKLRVTKLLCGTKSTWCLLKELFIYS